MTRKEFLKQMWMVDAQGGLAAVLYGASTVRAAVGRHREPVEIHQETHYPFEDAIHFTIRSAKAVTFPLSLRIPDLEIVANTLAPDAESYLAPWPRTNVPGEVDGGHEFDLARWNTSYFQRLEDFVAEASRRGIVVEVSLFSPYYVPDVGNRFWEVSPWNIKNNINGIGNLPGGQVLTLKDTRLVSIQDALARKDVPGDRLLVHGGP